MNSREKKKKKRINQENKERSYSNPQILHNINSNVTFFSSKTIRLAIRQK